jgi:CDP-glucose 4,6-dehydratase
VGLGPGALEDMALDASFWSGRRVLLTGHTGFKGSWLALWLASLGAEVTGFATAPPSDPSLFALADVARDLDTIEGDVRDLGAVRAAYAVARPSIVLHLAAQPLVRASYADPVGTYEANVIGTANVLEAARGASDDLHSIVVVTTDKCYLNRELDQPFTEDDPLGGHDPYSSSKAGAELVAAAYRDSYELPIATGRAGNVIGGGDFGADRLVPDAMRAVAAGDPLRVRNPDAIRPWQHVLCPLHGYGLLAERGERQPFNFGPAEDEARPVRWVADRLGVEWQHDGGDHPHEAHYLRLDSSKARAQLGWEPRWDLEHGLDATAEWYAAHREGGDVRQVVLDQISAYSAA